MANLIYFLKLLNLSFFFRSQEEENLTEGSLFIVDTIFFFVNRQTKKFYNFFSSSTNFNRNQKTELAREKKKNFSHFSYSLFYFLQPSPLSPYHLLPSLLSCLPYFFLKFIFTLKLK
jgi:hypothetical protein